MKNMMDEELVRGYIKAHKVIDVFERRDARMQRQGLMIDRELERRRGKRFQSAPAREVKTAKFNVNRFDQAAE
jgi:hypothetical protein